jgi:flagellar hook-associated protein 1
MADLLQIGLTGLNVSQTGLTTTGHNISNINNKSYSRQVMTADTLGSQRVGNSFLGSGAQVKAIERQYDQFAYRENLINTTSQKYYETKYLQAQQLDSLLTSDTTSVSASMLTTFDSMNGVADHPNTLEARKVFLRDAGNMTSTFNRLYDQMQLQYDSTNDDISKTVTQLNTLASSLADVNNSILTALGGDPNRSANDLFDQRDELVRQVSEIANVSVIPQANGMINVSIGTGQPLVLGAQATTFGVAIGNPDPQHIGLVIETGASKVPLDGSVIGGKLQSLFEFRDQVLEPGMDELGLNALAIAHSINEQQKQGQDLDGQIGGPLFTDFNSTTSQHTRVLSHGDGLGTATLGVRIDDLGSLSGNEFELKVTTFNAGPPQQIQFSMTDKTTGQVQTLPAAGPLDLSTDQRVDVPGAGFSIGIESIDIADPVQVGKTFTLRPTRMAAQDMAVIESDPRKVAAADAEVKVATSATNTGTSKLTVKSMNDRSDALYPSKDNPYTVAFTGVNAGPPTVYEYEMRDKNGVVLTVPPGASYTVTDNTGAALTLNPGDPLTGLGVVLDPLTQRQTVDLAGITLELDGAPAVNDSFTLSFNQTADGDNRNALAIAGLQTQKLLKSGKQTFQDNYAALGSEIGSVTKNAKTSMDASEALLEQSTTRVLATAGVSLDEEAANLIKFQQSYSASARVITVAGELFSTLLQSFR